MTNNIVQIKIWYRDIKVSVDGLSKREIGSIAGQVERRMKLIREKSNHVADTSGLAILAAFEFAIELYNLKRKIYQAGQKGSQKESTEGLKI